MAKYEINNKIDILIGKAHDNRNFKRFWFLFRIFINIYIYKLTNPRDIFPKYLGYIATSLIFIFSFIPTIAELSEYFVLHPLRLKLISNLSNAIIGISASLLAAIFIDIAFRLRDEYQIRTKGYRLKRFLGCELENDSAIIVVPKYPMARNREGELGYVKDYYRFTHDDDFVAARMKEEQENNDLEKSIHYFSTLAYQDVIAAANIVSIFEDGDLSRPKIKTDTEILKNLVDTENHTLKYSDKYPKTKTFICIGLFSNEISMWINNKLDETTAKGKFFKFFKGIDKSDILEEKLGYIQLASYKNSRVELVERKWLKESGYRFTGHADGQNEYTSYGLISKVFVGDKVFIIMGGLTARSTKELGRYFKNNWKTLIDLQDKTTNEKTDKNPYSFVFRIDETRVSPNPIDTNIRIDKIE